MALLPQSPEQQKRMLVGLFPLLLLFAYYQFMHRARAAEIANLETELEILETGNAAAKILAEQGGPELEQRLAMLEQHMVRLEELIPDREEVPDLLHSMGLRAQSTGVELTRVKPELEEVGPYYTKQTYEIGVKGTYHRLGQYLAEVGSLPRIITPVELKLQSNTNETERRTGLPLLNASFRIVTFIVPEPGAAPADTATVTNAKS
ncbi:MAG: type 4a pilus biogenesis protein PilO [Longimicrobiales bacterium]